MNIFTAVLEELMTLPCLFTSLSIYKHPILTLFECVLACCYATQMFIVAM